MKVILRVVMGAMLLGLLMGETLHDFCQKGGQWVAKADVDLALGQNQVNGSCLPCLVGNLSLWCPEGQQGVGGMKDDNGNLWVATLVGWTLAILEAFFGEERKKKQNKTKQ